MPTALEPADVPRSLPRGAFFVPRPWNTFPLSQVFLLRPLKVDETIDRVGTAERGGPVSGSGFVFENQENRMTKSFQFGLLTASVLALSSSAAFADYQLNILHINDFHSRIESINKFDSTCSAEEEGKNECFGGAARLKTAIDQRRAALSGQNVLTAQRRRQFPGLAVLHDLQGHGRTRDGQRDQVRRHDARQP
jgi:hypothetical protein